MKIAHLLAEKGSAARQARRKAQRDAATNPTPPAAGASAFGNMAQSLGGTQPGNTMANTPVSTTNVAKPTNPNLTVVPGGRGTASTTAAPATADPTTTTAPTATTAAPASAGPTGDPTLDQPLAPAAPKDPNAPGVAQRAAGMLGGLSKGIGAVAGIPQGMGRAMKKGYQSAVQNIGGPGSAVKNAVGWKDVPSMAPTSVGAPAGGASAGSADEIADLKRTIANMDRRMRSGGLEETKQSKKR
jgi:hypothetical protein